MLRSRYKKSIPNATANHFLQQLLPKIVRDLSQENASLVRLESQCKPAAVEVVCFLLGYTAPQEHAQWRSLQLMAALVLQNQTSLHPLQQVKEALIRIVKEQVYGSQANLDQSRVGQVFCERAKGLAEHLISIISKECYMRNEEGDVRRRFIEQIHSLHACSICTPARSFFFFAVHLRMIKHGWESRLAIQQYLSAPYSSFFQESLSRLIQSWDGLSESHFDFLLACVTDFGVDVNILCALQISHQQALALVAKQACSLQILEKVAQLPCHTEDDLQCLIDILSGFPFSELPSETLCYLLNQTILQIVNSPQYFLSNGLRVEPSLLLLLIETIQHMLEREEASLHYVRTDLHQAWVSLATLPQCIEILRAEKMLFIKFELLLYNQLRAIIQRVGAEQKLLAMDQSTLSLYVKYYKMVLQQSQLGELRRQVTMIVALLRPELISQALLEGQSGEQAIRGVLSQPTIQQLLLIYSKQVKAILLTAMLRSQHPLLPHQHNSDLILTAVALNLPVQLPIQFLRTHFTDFITALPLRCVSQYYHLLHQFISVEITHLETTESNTRNIISSLNKLNLCPSVYPSSNILSGLYDYFIRSLHTPIRNKTQLLCSILDLLKRDNCNSEQLHKRIIVEIEKYLCVTHKNMEARADAHVWLFLLSNICPFVDLRGTVEPLLKLIPLMAEMEQSPKSKAVLRVLISLAVRALKIGSQQHDWQAELWEIIKAIRRRKISEAPAYSVVVETSRLRLAEEDDQIAQVAPTTSTAEEGNINGQSYRGLERVDQIEEIEQSYSEIERRMGSAEEWQEGAVRHQQISGAIRTIRRIRRQFQ